MVIIEKQLSLSSVNKEQEIKVDFSNKNIKLALEVWDI